MIYPYLLVIPDHIQHEKNRHFDISLLKTEYHKRNVCERLSTISHKKSTNRRRMKWGRIIDYDWSVSFCRRPINRTLETRICHNAAVVFSRESKIQEFKYIIKHAAHRSADERHSFSSERIADFLFRKLLFASIVIQVEGCGSDKFRRKVEK